MRKRLFRSRSGEGYPMVIAVTLCLLMLFLVIAEYFRVSIIVQGVRDTAESRQIAKNSSSPMPTKRRCTPR